LQAGHGWTFWYEIHGPVPYTLKLKFNPNSAHGKLQVNHACSFNWPDKWSYHLYLPCYHPVSLVRGYLPDRLTILHDLLSRKHTMSSIASSGSQRPLGRSLAKILWTGQILNLSNFINAIRPVTFSSALITPDEYAPNGTTQLTVTQHCSALSTWPTATLWCTNIYENCFRHYQLLRGLLQPRRSWLWSVMDWLFCHTQQGVKLVVGAPALAKNQVVDIPKTMAVEVEIGCLSLGVYGDVLSQGFGHDWLLTDSFYKSTRCSTTFSGPEFAPLQTAADA